MDRAAFQAEEAEAAYVREMARRQFVEDELEICRLNYTKRPCPARLHLFPCRTHIRAYAERLRISESHARTRLKMLARLEEKRRGD